jgi:hypothetical protein
MESFYEKPDAGAFAELVNKLLNGDEPGIELQVYFEQPGFEGTEEVILHEGDTVEIINANLVYFHSVDDVDRMLSMRHFDIMNICNDTPGAEHTRGE